MTDTLQLSDAAQLLHMHPETLRTRAKAGLIPGASKPAKKWVFLRAGLMAYLASQCPYTASQPPGTLTFARRRVAFDDLLGLPPKRPRRNSTTA